ncbi:uncharacterized protein LOC110279903 [Arachis duranensis]|uniref:Uncharacterized protein LOC110279903 n=1 Tax=Arachis duranensis TaxID=130453 RepID=A0A9C6TXL0_ARADU|nr:uncharacterized protein LOC110279903 [Arachis duranensis]
MCFCVVFICWLLIVDITPHLFAGGRVPHLTNSEKERRKRWHQFRGSEGNWWGIAHSSARPHPSQKRKRVEPEKSLEVLSEEDKVDRVFQYPRDMRLTRLLGMEGMGSLSRLWLLLCCVLVMLLSC